jgi:hypothetical protein
MYTFVDVKEKARDGGRERAKEDFRGNPDRRLLLLLTFVFPLFASRVPRNRFSPNLAFSFLSVKLKMSILHRKRGGNNEF